MRTGVFLSEKFDVWTRREVVFIDFFDATVTPIVVVVGLLFVGHEDNANFAFLGYEGEYFLLVGVCCGLGGAIADIEAGVDAAETGALYLVREFFLLPPTLLGV